MTKPRTVSACVALSVLLAVCGWARAETGAGHRVQVAVLEAGSSVHTSLNNHDSYLMRVVPHHGEPFVARVMDDFPSYADPMPEFLRKQGTTFSVVLRLASFCDDRAANRDIDLARQSATPDGTTEPVRCFSLVHGSWKGDKLQNDEWWK